MLLFVVGVIVRCICSNKREQTNEKMMMMDIPSSSSWNHGSRTTTNRSPANISYLFFRKVIKKDTKFFTGWFRSSYKRKRAKLILKILVEEYVYYLNKYRCGKNTLLSTMQWEREKKHYYFKKKKTRVFDIEPTPLWPVDTNYNREMKHRFNSNIIITAAGQHFDSHSISFVHNASMSPSATIYVSSRSTNFEMRNIFFSNSYFESLWCTTGQIDHTLNRSKSQYRIS